MGRKTFVRVGMLCASVLLIAALGWAKTYHLTSTPMTPAASGDVDVHRDKNGNIQVDLKVEHLAKPSVLTPPASTYIVWFQQGDSRPESQGELRVNDDLKGELKTSTPYNTFDVFITAESDPQTKTPSDRVALKTSVQEPAK